MEQFAFFNTVKTGGEKKEGRKENEEEGKGKGEEKPEIDPVKLWWVVTLSEVSGLQFLT